MLEAEPQANVTMEPIDGDEEDLRQAIELLFFAYRDFTGEPDTVLSDFGFGRAHHRAIYFIGRNPDISVTDLLAILKITKQSLSRVLSQLIDEGYVHQETDAVDRRRRLLRLSERGTALERQLTARQCRRITRAYDAAGPAAVAGFRAILRQIIEPEDRERVGLRAAEDAVRRKSA
ncbi:MAG: MarR family transcriptional regulator [Rhodospirillaceae bacterium]